MVPVIVGAWVSIRIPIDWSTSPGKKIYTVVAAQSAVVMLGLCFIGSLTEVISGHGCSILRG